MFSFFYARILSKVIERHIHNYIMLKAFNFKEHEKKNISVLISNMHISQMKN